MNAPARQDSTAHQSTGKLYIIAGPSGSGKSTITAKLAQSGVADLSVSYTTRKKHKSEVEGKDYCFVTEEKFGELSDAGELLESARVHDCWYATPRLPVEEKLARGRNVMLEIDVQGARLIRATGIRQDSIFILPPSLDVLHDRLMHRKREHEAEIKKRFDAAICEIESFAEFDYLIVNTDVDDAAAAITDIMQGQGQEHRLTSQQQLADDWRQQLAGTDNRAAG